MYKTLAFAVTLAAIMSAPALAQKLAQSYDPYNLGTGNIVTPVQPSQMNPGDEAYRARAEVLGRGNVRVKTKTMKPSFTPEEKALFERISPFGD